MVEKLGREAREVNGPGQNPRLFLGNAARFVNRFRNLGSESAFGHHVLHEVAEIVFLIEVGCHGFDMAGGGLAIRVGGGNNSRGERANSRTPVIPRAAKAIGKRRAAFAEHRPSGFHDGRTDGGGDGLAVHLRGLLSRLIDGTKIRPPTTRVNSRTQLFHKIGSYPYALASSLSAFRLLCMSLLSPLVSVVLVFVV